MLEFLPGAKTEDKVIVAKPKSFAQSVKDTRKKAEAVEQHREKTTVAEGLGASAVKGSVGTIDRAITEFGMDFDPNWKLPKDFEEEMDRLGIDQSQWPLFGKATSQEHYEWLQGVARENQNADDTLSQFGIGGNIALGMTDPGAFAVDAMTGGLGTAARAGRVANLVRAGSVAAATNVTMDMAASRYDPNIGAEQMLTTAATSFALAGVLGARRGKDYVPRIKALAEKPIPDQSLSAARVAGTPQAPEVHGAPDVRKPTPTEEERMDEAISNAHILPAFRGLRRSLSARMGKFNSPLLREAGRKLFREGVGYTTKGVDGKTDLAAGRKIAVQESTIEFARRHIGTHETRLRTGLNAAWSEFAKENNIHGWNAIKRTEFNREVSRAVRGDANVSPQAAKAAKVVREVNEGIAKLAHDSGLPGFDKLDSQNYLARYYSPSAFRTLFGEMGLHVDEVADKLLVPALRRAWEANLVPDANGVMPTLDEDVLRGVAKAMIQRGQKNLEQDFDGPNFRSLGKDDIDEIREMLDDGGVPKSKIDEFLRTFEDSADESGKVKHAKQRIDIDENFEAEIENELGQVHTVRVSDLWENDIDTVMSKYMREMVGWSAMSDKFGIKNRKDWAAYRKQLTREAVKNNDNVKSLNRMLDIAYNSTFHRSTEPDAGGFGSRMGRAVRAYGFLRVMGQVGWSMVAELGPTIAHSGLRNFLKSVRYADDFLLRGADGKLSSAEARATEAVFAPGTDWLRNPPLLRLEDGANIPHTFGEGRVGRALDNAMHYGQYAQGVLSGMAPINTFMQRIAGRATWYRLIDLANSGKVSKADIDRLRSWGLDDASQTAVFKALKGAKRIEDINLDKMDFRTRESMSAFLYRATRQQVLEADPADSIELMHGPVGKVLTQFRTFMFNSYERHFLNGVYHLRDWRTYMMIALSTGAAGMGWTARTYLNTIGDEEKRKKYLTRENFYKNAFAQSSYSAIFPALIDFAATDVLGGDPVFQGNRSTGMGNGLNGVPIVDAYNKLRGDNGAIAGISDAFNPNAEMTRDQAESMWKLMWFNNLTGVQQLSNLILRENFEDKKRDKAEEGDDEPTPLFD